MNLIKKYIVTLVCLVAVGLPEVVFAAARRRGPVRPVKRAVVRTPLKPAPRLLPRIAPRVPRVPVAPKRAPVARAPIVRRPVVRRAPAPRLAVARPAPVRRAPVRGPVRRPAPAPRAPRLRRIGGGEAFTVPVPAPVILNFNTPLPAPNPANRVMYVPVMGQNGATCAYHALENGYRVYQKLMYDYAVPPVPLEELRQQIIERRRALLAAGRSTTQPGAGEMLDDGEVEFLGRYRRMGANTFTVIPSVTTYDPILQNLDDVKRELATDGAVHAFIINSGRQVGDDKVIGGHWIAVVVLRVRGDLYYYVMDSMNGRPQVSVRALQVILEDPNPIVIEVPVVKAPTPAPAGALPRWRARAANLLSAGVQRLRQGAARVTNAIRARAVR
jgi:hypothetical protein